MKLIITCKDTPKTENNNRNNLYDEFDEECFHLAKQFKDIVDMANRLPECDSNFGLVDNETRRHYIQFGATLQDTSDEIIGEYIDQISDQYDDSDDDEFYNDPEEDELDDSKCNGDCDKCPDLQKCFGDKKDETICDEEYMNSSKVSCDKCELDDIADDMMEIVTMLKPAFTEDLRNHDVTDITLHLSVDEYNHLKNIFDTYMIDTESEEI